MKKSNVAEVHQIVGDQFVAQRHPHRQAGRVRVAIREMEQREASDFASIGLLGLSRPNPDNPVAFNDGELAHPSTWRYHWAVRIVDTRPAAIVAKSVIQAFDLISYEFSETEWREA